MVKYFMERLNKTQHSMSKQEFTEARLDALEDCLAYHDVKAMYKIDAATALAIDGYMNGDEVEYIFNEMSNSVMVKVGDKFNTFVL